MLKIFDVKFHFFRDWQFITAIDLRPAREARNKFMDASCRSQRNEVILIEQRRAGADETHVAFQNAPELRQLVQARLAQKGANGRQMAVRVGQQMGGERRGVDAHASKLRHLEDAVVSTNPVAPVKNRANGRQANSDGDTEDRKRQEECGDHGQQKIKWALHGYAISHVKKRC